MIYTLNTFDFGSLATIDCFIRHRLLGQRRLIRSINVPFQYYDLYHGDFRKRFCQTFPNVLRIGLHHQVALISQRVIESTWKLMRPVKEPLEETKTRIAEFVRRKEGVAIEIDWHSSMDAPLIQFLYWVPRSV